MAIKQLITLEGAEAFQKALIDTGEAGVKAFKQLQDAINKVDSKKLEDSFKGISKEITNITDSIGTLSDDLVSVGKSFLVIGASISAAAVGFVAWVRSGAQAEVAIQNLARQAQVTPGEMQGLIGALSQSGVEAGGLETAFKRLAVRVATDWPAIQKSIRDAADNILKDQLAVEASTRNLERAQIALAQFNRDQSKQPTGTAATPSTAFEIQTEKDSLALLEKADLLAKVSEAEIKQSEATKKAADNLASSEAVTKKFVEGLAQGLDNATSNITRSVDNIFKGIVASAGTATTQLKSKGGIIDVLDAPNLEKVLFLLADVMKNMRSETDKTALSVLAFGRGVGENMVHFLSQGSGKVKELSDELKSLGLLKFDAGAARTFDESLITLGLHVELIFRQIKDLFIPGLTTAFETLDQLLLSNKDSLLELGRTIANNVLSVIRDLIFLMTGKSGQVQNQWILDWQAAILNLKDNIVSFKDDAIAAFNEVSAILDSVAANINKLFGTNLTGRELGIGFIVAQFVGLNAVILDVIKTIGLLLIALIAIPLLIPATLGALIPALIAFVGSFIGALAILLAGDFLQKPFNDFMNWLVDEFFPNLGNSIVNAWNGVVQSFLSAIDATINSVKQKWQALLDFLQSHSPGILGQAGGTESVVVGGGLAGGGMVRGPGSSTSDSILAWLSDREFVVNARAVSHYGADFFAALNNMRLPRDMGFNMGGLVQAMMRPLPGFAGGGMVSSGTPVNIVIGQNTFRLSASQDTAQKLKQYSISSQLSSAGRKPSWVR